MVFTGGQDTKRNRKEASKRMDILIQTPGSKLKKTFFFGKLFFLIGRFTWERKIFTLQLQQQQQLCF